MLERHAAHVQLFRRRHAARLLTIPLSMAVDVLGSDIAADMEMYVRMSFLIIIIPRYDVSIPLPYP